MILNWVRLFSVCEREGNSRKNQRTLRDLKCKSLLNYSSVISYPVGCLTITVWGLILHYLCDGVPSGLIERNIVYKIWMN